MRARLLAFTLLAAPACLQTADVGDLPRTLGDASDPGCALPFEWCGEQCVDLLTNPFHCGGCERPCSSGCVLGRCPGSDGGASPADGGTPAADAGGRGDAAQPTADAGSNRDAGGGADVGVPSVCGGAGSRCARDSDCCPSYQCDTYYGYCDGDGCTIGDCDQRACCAGMSCQWGTGAHSYCETATNCVPAGGTCDSVSDCCLGTGCTYSSGGFKCTEGKSCRGWHQTCASDTDCCPGEGYSCRTYRYDGKVCVSDRECGVIATPCGWDGVPCCSGYTCRSNGDGTSSCSN